ncbi:MAG: hypothetical protein ABFD59_09960 [Smithella sp.]
MIVWPLYSENLEVWTRGLYWSLLNGTFSTPSGGVKEAHDKRKKRNETDESINRILLFFCIREFPPIFKKVVIDRARPRTISLLYDNGFQINDAIIGDKDLLGPMCVRLLNGLSKKRQPRKNFLLSGISGKVNNFQVHWQLAARLFNLLLKNLID